MASPEQLRDAAQQIIRIIGARRDTYDSATMAVALSKSREEKWYLSFGLLEFLHKNEKVPDEFTYDYGNFVLIRRLIDIPAAIQVINSAFQEHILRLHPYPDIHVDTQLPQITFVESNKSYSYVISEWPMTFFSASMGQSIADIPMEALSGLGLPLFPDGHEAIRSLFGLYLPDGYSARLDKHFDILVPDYRARITNLRLAEGKASVDVQVGAISERDLVAKFFCRGAKGSHSSDDIVVNAAQATYKVDERPQQVVVQLLSRVSGERIDEKTYNYRYPIQAGVTIEDIETRLLDVIGGGENEQVEFKKELNKKSQRGFLRTIVAFANTTGGMILLGVKDSGEISGFKIDTDDVENLVSEFCDPPIRVQVSSVELHNLPMTVVRVQEGTNKPYLFKDKGIFVRRGGSSRQIRRVELDELYQRKPTF